MGPRMEVVAINDPFFTDSIVFCSATKFHKQLSERGGG